MKRSNAIFLFVSIAGAAPMDGASGAPPPQSSAYYLDCYHPLVTQYCIDSWGTYCTSSGQLFTNSESNCGLGLCACEGYIPCNHICTKAFEAMGDAYDPSKTYEYAHDAEGHVVSVRPISDGK
ncbi:hypothetical protein F5Y19DRAFT_483141 [Xylariaceae sp. FL1651]|nr:hypothetical protein F5Y19DRAFT_483141 [Xylariaceae sp. FL1651]